MSLLYVHCIGSLGHTLECLYHTVVMLQCFAYTLCFWGWRWSMPVFSCIGFVRLFVRWGSLGCWQSMWHTSSHHQRWGLELAQCITLLTLGLVLYILRAQISLQVSLARCQWCDPVLQVEPLALPICYPRRQLLLHPDAPNPGVMACHSLRDSTCPRI